MVESAVHLIEVQSELVQAGSLAIGSDLVPLGHADCPAEDSRTRKLVVAERLV